MLVASLFLIGFGCQTPPLVDGVSPKQGPPGTGIAIVGANFTPETTATLGGEPVSDLEVKGVAGMTGTVPESLDGGPAVLVVTTAGGTASLAGAFTVRVQAPESVGVPCAGEFTAFSQLAMGRNTIVIDKHYKPGPNQEEGEREVVRLNFREVERIEYVETPVPGEEGAICSAIYVVTKAGERHLFDDDSVENLQARANEIAVGLQKPIEVVRSATE